MNKLKMMVGVIAISMLAASNTYAEGWIAGNIIKPLLGEEAARAADDWNARSGHPVERAAIAAANTYVPGSGPYLQAGFELQQAGVFQGRGGNPQPGYGGGYPAPQPPQFQPQAQMSNFCTTPTTGRAGPFNNYGPVGSSCYVNTPYGVAYGVITF